MIPTKYMPSGGGYCPLAMSGLDPALSWVCTSVSAGGPVIVRGRHAGAAVVVSGACAVLDGRGVPRIGWIAVLEACALQSSPGELGELGGAADGHGRAVPADDDEQKTRSMDFYGLLKSDQDR